MLRNFKWAHFFLKPDYYFFQNSLQVLCIDFAVKFVTFEFLKAKNCPISSWGAKYLVRLANHLADVHQLDHIQWRQYLQEAKLQPTVEVVVYESEADNSGKKHYRSLVQTQETVYELSRSQRNEAKRSTTKNKTKREKQRKSNSWLRVHRKIV